ncbi:MAG: Xaa-Pro dipeptidase [Thermomicrobiales bacterium]|jgi:Xaa-Pro dipeptidase|nr:Xaa-Pro dipeptidase [Thermomicrobiales bacterium]
MALVSTPPQIDFAARIARLRGVLADQQLDAAVVMAPANIAYLSGFQALLYSRPIYLVVDATRTELIVPGLEEEHATHADGIDAVHVYYEHPEKGTRGENAPDTLAARLQAIGARRAGLEYGSAPIALREHLEGRGLTTGNLSPAIIKMRLIKDEGEIALMRQAAALARIGVMATLEAAAPGQSQLAIESIGTNAILEAAPELTPDATINLLQFTTSGPETSLPHLITTTRRLNRPDLAIHSRQVSVDGERAELERTFAIGSMDAQTRRVFDVAEEAQLAAIAACHPGTPMREVDAAARRVIQAAGFGEYSIHRTGHGLGIEAHEAPYIRWDVDEPLEVGMVVSIEPGIYIPAICGARHSDTVVVTASGPETITDAPRGAENLILDR